MADFTVHSPATAPEGAQETLAGVEKAWGFVPQLHGMLAESPVALRAYDALFGLVSTGTLTPAEQQVAYLAINVFNECEYCTSGHTYLARQAGLPEDAIAALRDGHAIPDARLEALRVFATAVVEARGFVGDAAVDAFLAADFTKAQVLEVITIAATKTISNYTNHITKTPKEGFMADPSLAWTAPGKLPRAA